MRSRQALIAMFLILATAIAIAAGGSAILRRQDAGAERQAAAAGTPQAEAVVAQPTRIGQAAQPPAPPPTASRTIDPDIVAPPHVDASQLERAEPRAPLSTLSRAEPPKPKEPGEWTGEPLFHPFAEAAGIIVASDRTITISGIEMVAPGQSCADAAGKSWPCGAQARTAFRGFLRGRAVTCAEPDKAGMAQCRVGKEDVGEWLVENGWARAAADGPYGEAGDKAKASRKGVFGTPPDLSGLPPAPPPTEVAPEAQGSILDLSGEAPPLEPATPPVDPPVPFQ